MIKNIKSYAGQEIVICKAVYNSLKGNVQYVMKCKFQHIMKCKFQHL